MLTTDIDKKRLFALMKQEALVITPNNRLSASLLRQYYEYKGEETLSKVPCMPYNQVLRHWFDTLRFTQIETRHPYLLNANQCRYLWQNIIKETAHVTYNEGLLNAVLKAWNNCEQWQVAANNPTFSHTPQTQIFQKWWTQFNQQLEQLEALCHHQLVAYLIKNNVNALPKTIIWACFDELSPEQISLRHYLQELGIVQFNYDLENNNQDIRVGSFSDTQEEYQQLIAWLHSRLAKNEQRIGVVIPELEQEARTVKRLLNQHLDPALFNISLGEPLSDYPLIAHALCWLDLQEYCSMQQAQLLVQSPYIKAAKEEFLPRAQCLQDSTILQQPQCALAQLADAIQFTAPKLAQTLNSLKSYPEKASPFDWVLLFQQRLNSIGFPGDYDLNSYQYQCYQRFLLLLEEFRQIQLVHNQLSANDALGLVHELAKTTIFQAQKQDAPIQILGLLEASGCEFDSVWVMGLTDHCLPAKTHLSAFIPPQLQRDLGMPHSTAHRELSFAHHTLQRIQYGSKDTVFSYPKLQGDSPQLPSPLIKHLPLLEPIPSAQANEEHPSPVHIIHEEYTHPVQPGELLRGGTALLANQAKCPFKAFAAHRLRAKPVLDPAEGIDNKERGTLLHKVMELLWEQLQNQASLFKHSEEELLWLIDKTITKVLSASSEHHHQVVCDIEYKRLKNLAHQALMWERQRPAFTVIGLEQAYTIAIAGLEINVRVDRLDKVADKLWVIDYKSTLPANKPWNEERPQEPQLLLYALLNEEINTLLLMQIKTGAVLGNGLSAEDQAIKGISTLKKEQTWSACRDFWKQQLTVLGEEIKSGYCPPTPINSNLCTLCDFKNLCRINFC